MKKKISILSALFMAVLITAYSVSGTFAKYISAIDMTDSARVAVWDINATKSNVNLFSNQFTHIYNKATNGTANVIAPGTYGEYKFSIYGGAETEVDYTVDINIDGYDLINNTCDYDMANDKYINCVANDYKPIVYYLDGTEVASMDALVEAIKDIYKDASGTAGIPLTDTEHTIRWEWLYEDLASAVLDANGNVVFENDAKDTEIGSSMDTYSNYLTDTAAIGLTVEISAVQEEPEI